MQALTNSHISPFFTQISFKIFISKFNFYFYSSLFHHVLHFLLKLPILEINFFLFSEVYFTFRLLNSFIGLFTLYYLYARIYWNRHDSHELCWLFFLTLVFKIFEYFFSHFLFKNLFIFNPSCLNFDIFHNVFPVFAFFNTGQIFSVPKRDQELIAYSD
jgi:hypothetical protein